MYIRKENASFFFFPLNPVNKIKSNRIICLLSNDSLVCVFYSLYTIQPNAGQRMGTVSISAGVAPENALDALLDELQTFSKPTIGMHEVRITILFC